MSEVSLMPGNTGGWGGDALSAGFGAFVGSMFGNGCGVLRVHHDTRPVTA